MADEQTNPTVPGDAAADNAAKLPPDTTDEANPHDPMSPHAVAPQIQDEEAEKADVVEEQHDVAPAADQTVSADTDTAESVNAEVEKPEKKDEVA